MFRPIEIPISEQSRKITIMVNGIELVVHEGQSVAMALLGAGIVRFRRSAVSGAARAPLCMMGVCFDCLVEVDGVQNTQSCLVEVHPGMVIQLPDGNRSAT